MHQLQAHDDHENDHDHDDHDNEDDHDDDDNDHDHDDLDDQDNDKDDDLCGAILPLCTNFGPDPAED